MRKYSDKLDPKTRAELEKEIVMFNDKSTRELIEREAVGSSQVNAYQDWEEKHLKWNNEKEEMQEDPQANPDELSNEDLINHPLSYPVTDEENRPNVFQQQVQLIMEKLSPREKE